MDKVFFVFPTELLLREIIETIISAEKEWCFTLMEEVIFLPLMYSLQGDVHARLKIRFWYLLVSGWNSVQRLLARRSKKSGRGALWEYRKNISDRIQQEHLDQQRGHHCHDAERLSKKFWHLEVVIIERRHSIWEYIGGGKSLEKRFSSSAKFLVRLSNGHIDTSIIWKPQYNQ